MTTKEKIIAAKELAYDADIDALYADGKLLGGASDLTRDMMLARLDDQDGELSDASDETLFDYVVENVNSADEE